jgi:tRNA A37 threonylcarbamoyladenosine synthetase subunit TsaC/SUA5/YrdC
MSRIIRVNNAGLTVEELARVQAVLEEGDPIAFPTETVYGLGVLPSVDHASRRLNELKGRSPDHPLTLHLAPSVDVEQRSGVLSPLARRLAGRFCPGTPYWNGFSRRSAEVCWGRVPTFPDSHPPPRSKVSRQPSPRPWR